MPIPKYDEMYADFLRVLADNRIHSLSDIQDAIAKKRHLTEDELAERAPNKPGTVFSNRVAWTKAYLMKAKLICSAKRGYCRITTDGQKLLSKRLKKIDNTVLSRYKGFTEYLNSEKVQDENIELRCESPQSDVQPLIDEAPDELITKAVDTLNKSLADELLQEIMEQTPAFFEWLVPYLLGKMGYGVSERDLSKISHQSRDGGIDGVIRQDKLGFSKIYIQAKRWDPQVVGTAHGLFITTARFSDDAKKYAENRGNIVLVDGIRLVNLMIEHNVGVSVETQYVIKKIDSDFFKGE